jgi:hypothetical protein
MIKTTFQILTIETDKGTTRNFWSLKSLNLRIFVTTKKNEFVWILLFQIGKEKRVSRSATMFSGRFRRTKLILV